MAKKILIAVALLAMVIICCHIESVSGGEMGGHAKKRSSYSSSSTRRRIRSHHHSRQSWVTPKPANSSRSLDRLEGDTDWMAGVSFCLFFLAMALYDFLPMLFGTDSVLVFQVAFQGATGRICQDLDLISDAMDASLLESHSPRWLHLLLSETVSCLCRYGGESCFSAYPNVNKKWRLTGGWKKSFDLVCNVERKKQDAHVNVNHRYVIVTILVAANCKYELPAINCYSELESALRSLTSIKDTQIEAIKVFWTSRDDMEDFTSLIPI